MHPLFPRLICFVGWALLLSGLGFAAERDPQAPNILLIVADDLGYADLGYHGSPDIQTPHLDALARSGVSFSNAYVTAPVCMPSRMGMLTGRYQQRFGMQTLGNDAVGIPASETNLAQMLRGGGYTTAVIGKWHLGGDPEFRPNVRGFDEFYGFLDGNISYYPGSGQFWHNDAPTEKPPYATDGFGEKAVDFIHKNAGRPFFLYLAFNAPHTPMQAPRHYYSRFAHIADPGRRMYAAMVAAMDDNIGRVLGALRAERIEDNTLIVFLSDNGGAPQNYSANDPLRSYKYEVFEGGVRVPLVVRWRAGGVQAGTQSDWVVSALDLVPTLLAASGTPYRVKLPLDGENLLPLLRGQNHTLERDRPLYWRYGPYQAAMRSGDWKLIQCGVGNNQNPAWELYHLSEDPGETKNLASAEPSRLQSLLTRFEAWDRSLPPPTVMDQRLREGRIWWRQKAKVDLRDD